MTSLLLDVKQNANRGAEPLPLDSVSLTLTRAAADKIVGDRVDISFGEGRVAYHVTRREPIDGDLVRLHLEPVDEYTLRFD